MAAALASCSAAERSTPFDARIAFHESKLREDPGLYAVHAELGEALLERARFTHDPGDVRRARAALERSIDIQPSFHAFKAMSALSNFAHRFEEALGWAERAAAAQPEDTGVTAQQVESLLGLGRVEEAAAVLRERGAPEPDFYLTAAQGRILAARGDVDGAVAAFERAAEIAARFRAQPLALWSEVSAAAALIDSGRAGEAESYLEAGAEIDAEDPLLLIHQAEFLAAQGREREAVEIYDSLLERYGDPVLHAAAFELERRLENERAARRHFRAAERGFERAIEAGEVYTLEPLARLHLAAGTKLAEARRLAQRNLEFKRDAGARRVLEAIEARLREER